MRSFLYSFLQVTLGLFLLDAAFLPVRAWDPDGHEIIATIALHHLNPKARAAAESFAVQVVGPEKSYDPVTIACWMDDLRGHYPGLPYQGMFFPWHYIDFGLDSNDPQPPLNPGGDNETSGNIITGLKRAMVVLQGGSDPYVKSQAMAYALVMHLVGDIHQPLHAAAYFHQAPDGKWLNDAGGNRVAVINGPEIQPKYNLHYFWDAAWRVSWDATTGRVVVDPRYENWNHHDAQVVQAISSELETAFPPAAGTKLDPDFLAWAQESNRLSREVVYPRLTFTENHKVARISAEYVAMANPLARGRLVLAGLRLAALLNSTLGAAPSGAIPAAYPAGPPAADFSDKGIPFPSKK